MRHLYGCTSADFTTTPGGRIIPGADCTLWDEMAGGTPVEDLTDLDGNPTPTVTSDGDGGVRFHGPDGYTDTLWVDTGQGRRTAVRPVELVGRGDTGPPGEPGPPGEITEATGDARYVRKSGDTMTGPLAVQDTLFVVDQAAGSGKYSQIDGVRIENTVTGWKEISTPGDNLRIHGGPTGKGIVFAYNGEVEIKGTPTIQGAPIATQSYADALVEPIGRFVTFARSATQRFTNTEAKITGWSKLRGDAPDTPPQGGVALMGDDSFLVPIGTTWLVQLTFRSDAASAADHGHYVYLKRGVWLGTLGGWGEAQVYDQGSSGLPMLISTVTATFQAAVNNDALQVWAQRVGTVDRDAKNSYITFTRVK